MIKIGIQFFGGRGSGGGKGGGGGARAMQKASDLRDKRLEAVNNTKVGKSYVESDEGFVFRIDKYSTGSGTRYGAYVRTPVQGGYFQSNYLTKLSEARAYVRDKIQKEYESTINKK